MNTPDWQKLSARQNSSVRQNPCARQRLCGFAAPNGPRTPHPATLDNAETGSASSTRNCPGATSAWKNCIILVAAFGNAGKSLC